MSTDTDEEGNGGAEIDWAEDEGQVDEIVSPVSKLDNPQPSVPSLLITSNVGSIFEDPDILIPQWKKEVLQLISRTRPHFVALHFQEVGGKNLDDDTLGRVRQFSRDLVNAAESLGFDRHIILLDLNHQNREKFTALGCAYLIHKSLQEVEIYNFQHRKFQNVTESLEVVGNMDDVNLEMIQKHKFPLQFFPDNRLSRKGYTHTRFRLHGKSLFDLINIHLIHDASNLISCESSPSVYCEFRRRALEYTLDRVHKEDNVLVPFFIFGDFNFRLEARSVLHRLSSGLQREESEKDLVLFKDNEDQVLLSIGKKEFQVENHEEAFIEQWSQWTEFDKETNHLEERLSELPISFPPTYPYEEDPNQGQRYLRTRCPAWCDRILFSHQTKPLIKPREGNQGSTHSGPKPGIVYDVIGKDICMGDHKPVFLSFDLHCKELSESISSGTPILSMTQTNRCPRVESPTYTDLLSNTNLPCTRYVEIKDVARSKLFKETTV